MRITVRNQPKQIVHKTLSQKTLHKNKVSGVAQGGSSEFKPQYSKKKKKNGRTYFEMNKIESTT
jgi:hypothetical protein